MRPLTLHASALNDLEYNLYTSSLNDLAVSPDLAIVHDDARYESMSVGIREVRAWIQGRYPTLQVADIDKILKLFHPNMLHTDYLTGGQFFAALRLVLHSASGKGVDRTLAFVQAYPSLGEVVDQSRPTLSEHHAPPSHPGRYKQYATSSSSSSPDMNPFARKSLESDMLQSLPPGSQQFDTPPVIPSRLPHKISHNPFLMRDKVNGTNADNRSPERPKDGKIPPLPPRKPAPLVAPKRRISSAQPPLLLSAPVPSPFYAPHHDIIPSHVMTPLMKQSLEASKHGQNMKRLEEQLDRERVLQVLKTTSSGSSASSRTRSLSPTKQPHKGFGVHSYGSEDTYAPPLPRRQRPSSSSSTSSLLSIDQVASASVNHQSSLMPTSFRPPLPIRESTLFSTLDSSSHLPAPPTHPDRRSTIDTAERTTSTTPRVTRSKSMHHTPTPPRPPPRRKHTESVQLTPTANINTAEILSTSSQARSSSASFQGLSRHVSLTRDRSTTEASPISHIQKTISNLQLKAQPRLDAARYKAEAGLSRRGFVPHSPGGKWTEEGERGLMTDTDTRWEEGDDGTHVDRDADLYTEPSSANDESSSEEDRGRVDNTGVRRDFLKEADNLKWPAGEGWRTLES